MVTNPESSPTYPPLDSGFARRARPGMTASSPMAAYGLYTHIASNKFRSMLLLAGLFLLIYVLVYGGALVAEVVINSDASAEYYLMAASRDLVTAFPYATGAAALW